MIYCQYFSPSGDRNTALAIVRLTHGARSTTWTAAPITARPQLHRCGFCILRAIRAGAEPSETLDGHTVKVTGAGFSPSRRLFGCREPLWSKELLFEVVEILQLNEFYGKSRTKMAHDAPHHGADGERHPEFRSDFGGDGDT